MAVIYNAERLLYLLIDIERKRYDRRASLMVATSIQVQF